MRNQDWPKIRKRRTKVKGKAYTYYVVDLGFVEGKRKTRTFTPDADGNFPKEGQKWVEEKRRERSKIGKDALRLTDEQKQDAAQALLILKGAANLRQTAKFFVENNKPAVKEVTLERVIDEYLAEAEQDNLRPTSIYDLKTRLERLRQAFEGVSIAAISKSDATTWLRSKHTARQDGKPISPLTRKHYATVAGGLFNFAIEQGYISTNPFASASKRRQRNGGLRDEKMPEIISPAQVEALMAATQQSVPQIAAGLAIGFFAGLRTSEIQQLMWEDIDIDGKIITVLPRIAKRRYVRHVDIQDNLAAWLSLYRKDSGTIAPKGSAWRHKMDQVKKAATIDALPHNVMRHCFATYHLTMFQDQNKTALQLGHRNTDLLYRHYRNLATTQQAEEYWAIAPEEESNAVKKQSNQRRSGDH